MEEREQNLSEEGQARRRFLKQAGTVAWASPLILTMMSRAAQAQVGPVCGDVGLGDTECNVTAPCASPQQCVPNPASPGDCMCVTVPDPVP